jgi:hypothetical protein
VLHDLRTPRRQGWRRLRGHHLRTLAAAYAAGNCFASSQSPPSRPTAWAASWGSAVDRGLPLSPLALAFATLLAEAGPSELSPRPYWARPITMERGSGAAG